MMFPYDVLCVGSATVDRFLRIEQPLSSIMPGDKILVTSLNVYSGGGATNSAAALVKLGIKAKALAKLGRDDDAEIILRELKKYNVKNVCRQRSTKSTDFSTIVSSEKEKDRIIFVHKGSSEDLSFIDVKRSDLRIKWLYLATLTGNAFDLGKALVRGAHESGIHVLFNPSLYLAKKGKKMLDPILKTISILVLNKEEAQALLSTKTDSPRDLLLGLHELGPQAVIITNGAKRLYAYNSGLWYFLDPPDVEVVHTAGAGDAFTAGFLAGIIKKYSVEDALRLGQVNALSVIQHIGAKNKLLTEKEARELMQKYRIKVFVQKVMK